MADLTLSFFGSFQATLNGEPLTEFRTSKVQALLIYLTIEPNALPREALTTMLWHGMPDRSARHNLRQAIYYLRIAVPELSAKEPEHDGQVPLLLTNRRTIQLNQAANIEADVSRFEALIEATQQHDHLDLLTCPVCKKDLEKAVEFYQGDFLAEFYLDDSIEFEDWAQIKREAYRRQALDAMEVLTTIFIRKKEYVPARSYAEKQLEIDNLRESAYRQQMEALALSGQREGALAVYRHCARLLAEELGMAPSTRTTEVYEKIVTGDLSFEAPLAQGVRGYELKDEIGAGAYGAIHRAIQPTIGREVAVKVIHRRYANDPEFIRRFEAEAQTIAHLEHPHIVPLYDYWRDPDGAYLVMRYLKGGSLLSVLEAGPWNPGVAVKMLDQVCMALSAAHQQGIVHRDIKPANILLDKAGNAYLSDFGIAKDLGSLEKMTATGAVIGTPDYISPEQILDERIGPQSDLYSLGAVLYETLTGEKPFGDSSVANLIYKHINEPFPLVSTSRPDLPAGIDAVIQRATAKQPTDRYADALAMARAFRTAVQGADGSVGISAPSIVPAVELYNPYKGLRAFQEADSDDFFGRESLVDQLVDRLTDSRFLAVVGPSGSGKSSAVKAGLIPALRGGAVLPRRNVAGSKKWFVAEMVPGTHPLEELELALWPVAVNPPPSLVEPMERDTRGMLRTIRRIIPDEEGAQLLLVIDQFEELFTLVEDDERRAFFIDSLLQAIAAPRSPLRVVITLRADFYDRPLQEQSLGKLLKENTEIVLPLTPEELTWAVREPARRVGVGLEGDLVAGITADVADQPGALPLLQYALTELFERRQDGLMTAKVYKEIGGVLGALGRRADEIYDDLDIVGQEATRQLFLRLVTLGEGVEDTRRRVLRSELEAIDEGLIIQNSQFPMNSSFSSIIDQFGAARLLTFDHDPATRQPTVEVAHEALLREWRRLRGWLEESRNDVRMQRLLSLAAAEWEESDRDAGFLLREARLNQFEGWSETSTVALIGLEQTFLEASIAAREARRAEEEARLQRELETVEKLAETERARADEQAQAADTLRLRAIFLTGALIVAAVMAIAAVFAFQRASENERLALAEADSRAAAQAQEAQQRLVAEEAQARAEVQALLARSRELAAASTSSQATDPELRMLLALEALSTADTAEAQNALHAAVLGSRIRQRLSAHGDFIDSVAYSPDGSLIAMSSGDGTVSVWNAATGERLFAVPINTFGGTESILPVNLSPDGARLATVDPGDDLSLSYWDTANGGRLEQISLPIPTAGMTRYHLNPDWTQLAVGYEDGAAAIWDLGSGQLFAELTGHTDFVEPYYSPDGRWLATASDGTILVWDTATAALIRHLDTGGPAFFVSMSPDGRWLAYGDQNDAVQIWDLEAPDSDTGQEPFATLTGHVNSVFGLAFSPDSQLIATASRDGTSRLWDILTGEELLVLPHGINLTTVAFHPDGGSLLTGDFNGVARVWDISPQGSAERLALEAHSSFIRRASLSPDGENLATASHDGTAKIWDVATGRELQLLDGHLGGRVMDIAFHPEGRSLATAGNDGTARVWDTATGEELLSIDGHGEGTVGGTFTGVLSLDYSPDGNRLVTAGADGTARIWDGTTGEALLTLEGHTAGLTSVRFSPDGRYLATGSDEPDVTVRIWDAETGQELFALPPSHGDRVWDLDFNPDGRFLATSGGDTTAKIWELDYNANNGELLATLTAHSNTVGTVHFAPDGKSLATATAEEVRLWDVSTLSGGSEESAVPELLNLAGGWATVFSLDAHELITGNRDGLLRVYLLDPDELMELARSRLTRTWTAEECRQYRIEPCPVE